MEKLPSDLVEIEPDASSNLLESEAAEAFEKGMVCVRVGTTSRGCRSCCPSRCTYDSRPYGSYDRCCCGY
uniref:Uncharacterized protein n=1 Tax=Chromera velia CCMP2878 TaxID=1169474 RepID=A0A0G4HWA7_9ALVE|eukprot:Cvel_1438.t1-p1 / transcript=Cvel_1438.t1 / gene=Cvel_1438 / organism=Chromera_velia_CCMP2878 / gene_product=hypothetical protein / transcript_product=hypothetical protein / location=Cvel_scaffold50:86871-87077(+) / protein_length=69 / sequence_SO=supercontig / SO=protein_coding / is_pseudo=false